MKPPPPPPLPGMPGTAAPKRKGRGKALVNRGEVARRRAAESDLTMLPTTTKAIFRAFTMYVGNPGVAVKDVWERAMLGEEGTDAITPLKDCVALETLEKWCADNGWVERRRKHWLEIEKRVLAEAQSNAVDREVKEIEQLERLKQRLQQHIYGDDANGIVAAKPKSLEGAVQAFVNLDKHLTTKRDRIIALIAGAAGTAAPGTEASTLGESPQVPDNMSDEEVLRLAQEITQGRVNAPIALEDHGGEDDADGDG